MRKPVPTITAKDTETATRARRALRDRLIKHLHRNLTHRRHVQADLDALDRAIMPRIAESYQRQIDRFTQRIEQLDSAIAAIERRHYDATAASELTRQTRRLQSEEREILSTIAALAERAKRGEAVTTNQEQYSWRLAHVRAQLEVILAAISAI